MTEDWQPGLAATKVQPPVPPRHPVHRSRLDDALDAAVDARVPLVLVTAPAGSGKSTLLATWLATRLEAVAAPCGEYGDATVAPGWSGMPSPSGKPASTVVKSCSMAATTS